MSLMKTNYILKFIKVIGVIHDPYENHWQMRSFAKHDSVYNPIARIPTPLPNAFQPALRADVSRAGDVYDPGALTCTVFDPMVHPAIEGIKPYLESVLLGAGCLVESRQIRFYFC